MAAALVLDLKNEIFTCQKPCHHRDCESNRREWAGAICGICGKPMLPGERYYYATMGEDLKYIRFANQKGYTGKPHVHAACLEEAIEKERKNGKGTI